MLKKIAFATLAVSAGLFLVGQTRLCSYGGTAWKKIQVGAKHQIPVEFEIDRLKHEISQLLPDMKRNCTAIAEEIVAVQNLKEDVAYTRTNLDKQKQSVRALKDTSRSTPRRWP